MARTRSAPVDRIWIAHDEFLGCNRNRYGLCRKAPAGTLWRAGAAVVGRHAPGHAGTSLGRGRRAGRPAPDARAADLALALCARRERLRRHDDAVEGSTRRTGAPFHAGAA